MRDGVTVYLSGPMTGKPDWGRAAFNAAEEKYRRLGYKVLNPAILPTDLRPEAYMPICLAMLREADMIVMLEGWENSQGARMEAMYAAYRKINSIFDKEVRENGLD